MLVDVCQVASTASLKLVPRCLKASHDSTIWRSCKGLILARSLYRCKSRVTSAKFFKRPHVQERGLAPERPHGGVQGAADAMLATQAVANRSHIVSSGKSRIGADLRVGFLE
jgi:hypothetical protein